MGTGVAMVEVTGGCVGARVSDAVCGGADCNKLVHPAQNISIMVIPRIPIIWTGFIGRRSLSMSKMVWLYCKMCHMGGFFYFRAFIAGKSGSCRDIHVRSGLRDISLPHPGVPDTILHLRIFIT